MCVYDCVDAYVLGLFEVGVVRYFGVGRRLLAFILLLVRVWLYLLTGLSLRVLHVVIASVLTMGSWSFKYSESFHVVRVGLRACSSPVGRVLVRLFWCLRLRV